MSRGSNEGSFNLSVPAFGLHSFADTQMQMQRWLATGAGWPILFGYYHTDQLELFTTYHEHDVLVRTEILKNMDLPDGGSSPQTLLHGPRSLATSKVPSQRVPLGPGPQPSIRLLEPSHGNEDVLETLLSSTDAQMLPLSPSLTDKGRILSRTYSLHEVADILDHSIRVMTRQVRLTNVGRASLSNFPAGTTFFRPKCDRETASGQVTANLEFPYTIAAYPGLGGSA